MFSYNSLIEEGAVAGFGEADSGVCGEAVAAIETILEGHDIGECMVCLMQI